jgi:flagellin-like hook-associated protein FlgL
MLAGLDAFNSTFLAGLNTTENRITAANEQITSGFRVNEASDDPTAIEPILLYQSQIDQAMQVQTNLNLASTSASSADGALSNASTLLDNLTSIAAQGASSTATAASRTALSVQVQGVLQELVGLANTNVQGQYIFGGDAPSTQPYTFDWTVPGGVVQNNSAANTTTIQNASGSTLVPNLTAQQIFANGGTGLTGNAQRIDTPGATFVQGPAASNGETFNFSVFANGQTSSVAATVAASTNGQSLASVLSSLNSQLNPYGITAGTDSNGLLQFSGSSAFTLNEGAPSTGATHLLTSNPGTGAAVNDANYSVATQTGYSPTAGDTLQFQTSAGPKTVILAANGLTAAITQINAATASLGVYAVENSAGTGISFQGQNSFSVSDTNLTAFGTASVQTAAAPTSNTIFQTVYALGQALQNNDQAGAQNAAFALETSVTNLQQATTHYGNTETWIQDSQNSTASLLTNLQSGLGGLRGADVAAQATELTLDQTALQAALAAHGSLQIKSLFSYLG